MAKKAPVAKKKNEIAPSTKNGSLTPALAERMAKDAGKGVSTEQEDNLVPLIYILQPLSPQVNKRDAKYIDGAEASSIWLRNAAEPIVSGEDGIIFQPCYFYKDWVEWVPRDSGGGFVARYDACPPDAKKVEDPKNKNKVKFIRPNGNECIETRYHTGFVVDGDGSAMPYVIPMSSSGHTVSRQWMFMMNSAKLPNGEKPPSFALLYRLKTKQRTNAAGTWFTWDIKLHDEKDGGNEDGFVSSDADYERGLSLHNAFAKGEKRSEAPADLSHSEGGEDDKM